MPSTYNLFNRTSTAIKQSFEAWGHIPSKESLEAINDLALHLSKAVNEDLEPIFYLSSMDVGQGKSVTIKTFINELLATPESVTATGLKHHQVGVLVCLSTYDEIRACVEDIQQPEKVYIMVNPRSPQGREIASLGKAKSAQDAQILITTHAKIEKEFSAGKTSSLDATALFQDKKLFSYTRGKRLVRIWDESFLRHQPLHVTGKDIRAVLNACEHYFDNDLIDILEQVQADLRKNLKASQVYRFPDLEQHLKQLESSEDALQILSQRGGNGRVRHFDTVIINLYKLRMMSGALVSVGHHTPQDRAFLTYKPLIPLDFAPIIIADASGEFKQTYVDYGSDLKRLKSSRKLYSGHLDIHLYDIAAGKNKWSQEPYIYDKEGFRSGFDKLVAETAKVILEEPHRPQLVVHHKEKRQGKGKFSCPKNAILGYLHNQHPEYDTSQLYFLTWGRHRATNEFRDIPVVTLAGVLSKPQSVLEAIHRAAAEYPPADGQVALETLLSYEEAELSDDLCQAAGRGTMRKTDLLDPRYCPSGSRLNILASGYTKVPKIIETVWPDATIHNHSLKPLSLYDEVVSELKRVAKEEPTNQIVTFRQIKKNLNWKERGINSKRLADSVRKDPRYTSALSELGWQEGKAPGKQRITRWERPVNASDYGFV